MRSTRRRDLSLVSRHGGQSAPALSEEVTTVPTLGFSVEMRTSDSPFGAPEARTRSVFTGGFINVGDSNDPDLVEDARSNSPGKTVNYVLLEMVEKMSRSPTKRKSSATLYRRLRRSSRTRSPPE